MPEAEPATGIRNRFPIGYRLPKSVLNRYQVPGIGPETGSGPGVDARNLFRTGYWCPKPVPNWVPVSATGSGRCRYLFWTGSEPNTDTRSRFRKSSEPGSNPVPAPETDSELVPNRKGIRKRYRACTETSLDIGNWFGTFVSELVLNRFWVPVPAQNWSRHRYPVWNRLWISVPGPESS